MKWASLPAFLLALSLTPGMAAEAQPSRPGATAPQLAALGDHAVGVRSLSLVNPGQPDIAAFDPTTGKAPLADRRLQVLVWYPASGAASSRSGYDSALPALKPGDAPTPFRIEGLASWDAAPKAGPFPLVILSHGYGSHPEWMTWLAENLASKGYVVMAAGHADLPYDRPLALIPTAVNRPLDQAFLARAAETLARTPPWRGVIDTSRVAVIGHSMGGYGALRAAGASFNPQGLPARMTPGGLMEPLTRDAGPLIANLKAVVVIAPWGGQAGIEAFAQEGLGRVTTPVLFVSGDRDDIAGFADGPVRLFDRLTGASRTMVVFRGAGHTIGVNPAPAEAMTGFTTEEFFEDPVWRKARVTGISQHFITAFLDLHLKGMEDRRAFLALTPARSDDGAWPSTAGAPSAGAYAAGQPGVTLWRGFQRRWAEGLEIRTASPAP